MAAATQTTTTGRVIGGVWYLLVCAGFAIAGTVFGWASRSELLMNGIKHVFNPPKPVEVFNKDAVTFLILGCDQDVYYQGISALKHKARSDMMMVARMDFTKNEITGISIPRDTWCQLPGEPIHKINAYHALAPYGQEDAYTKKAVEYLLGGMDHVPLNQC